MKKTELLAPAGDMEKLKMAVLYGADAVYLAGTSYGLRGGPKNFTRETMPQAVAFAHAHGVKVHVAVNIMARNEDLPDLPDYLAFLNSIGVDALIIADLGAFMMAKKHAPDCELHVSTQVSIANYETAKAWYELGAKRVVLARELSLEEVREIRQKTPADLEIETFVHGAMCVSYSGRCLLSNYLTGRDGNGGACAQPCRDSYVLMSEKYPGQYIPIVDHEKGAYILNSRDMCMIEHVKELMEAGIDCFKVEGRNKSAYYAAIVAGAYRHVIDDVAAGREPDPIWMDEVNHIAHRHYSTGFYYGFPGQYYDDGRYIRQWQILAVAEETSESSMGENCIKDNEDMHSSHGRKNKGLENKGFENEDVETGHREKTEVTDANDFLAKFTLKNKIEKGSQIEIVGPDQKPFTMIADEMYDENMQPVEPKNPQMTFYMRVPKKIKGYSIVRKMA